MQVQNARRWAPRGARRWFAAVAALCIAAGVRLMLHPLLGPVMPGTAFAIAAVLVEYYFGLAPALTVMLAGLGIADYLFVPPYAALGVINRSDVLFVISYPLVALVVITLVERLRRAQFRAELITSVAQSRYEMLLRHDNDRMLARRAVDETHRLLHHLSQHSKSLVLIQALERSPAWSDGADAGSAREAAASAPAVALPPAEIAPGSRFDDVEPEDVRRLSKALWPGSHRLRLRTRDAAAGHTSPGTQAATSDSAAQLVDCVCERFTTHAGDFLVLRIGEPHP
ncbi:DUF4118 domain-containing protein [Burkholderia sp. Ac-20365]|uniref:DUF4118 domain-containing protein n=1 Tax=Burkholderia sp. Ac-20365 TaxID=2703897 RepID=UPI00197B6FF2|nr:DUF4118 domain-containing protein [Burkholderia sp. Ac-20365]MBN3763718.1 DUF4118 domain-containing protein [Burkholderia sp. Ac-20365]